MLVRSGLLGTTRPATEEELFCATLPFDFKYYCELRASIERGENNFVVLDPALNKVLFSNEHWVVTENAFPNSRPCAVMLMIVSKKPWRMLKDIVPEAWTTLGEAIAWVETKYDLPGGMLFLRFGDMRLNGGTKMHLHWNLWVPNGAGPLSVPIFKSEADRAIDIARAEGFAKRYEAGERA
jgi:diadenosine tetraphosphate (Ap4A) HIT family hydrolase